MAPTIITPSSMRTAKFFKSSVSRTEALHLYREGMFLCHTPLLPQELYLIFFAQIAQFFEFLKHFIGAMKRGSLGIKDFGQKQERSLNKVRKKPTH